MQLLDDPAVMPKIMPLMVTNPGRKANPDTKKGQTHPEAIASLSRKQPRVLEGMGSPGRMVWIQDLSWQLWSRFLGFALPIFPREAPLQCRTELSSRSSTCSCSGLKGDKNPEKRAAALAGKQGKLMEPPAAAEAIWGSSPPWTPPGVKPQIFPNNEIQPQINPQQHADKLLMFEITSLPTMKLSQFSTSTCSSQESPAWGVGTKASPQSPGNADFPHTTFPPHFQAWKGNTWEVLLHPKVISQQLHLKIFTSKPDLSLDFKSCIFVFSSVNVTFLCSGAVKPSPSKHFCTTVCISF